MLSFPSLDLPRRLQGGDLSPPTFLPRSGFQSSCPSFMHSITSSSMTWGFFMHSLNGFFRGRGFDRYGSMAVPFTVCRAMRLPKLAPNEPRYRPNVEATSSTVSAFAGVLYGIVSVTINAQTTCFMLEPLLVGELTT